MCRMKGKSAEQCQNYIRVLKLQSADMLYVCGTNSYKPRCRAYLITVSLLVTTTNSSHTNSRRLLFCHWRTL